MIAVTINAVEAGALSAVLSHLSRGEPVEFRDCTPAGIETPVFTIERVARAYVVRDPKGRSLATATTFAEAWRQRPRSTETAERASR